MLSPKTLVLAGVVLLVAFRLASWTKRKRPLPPGPTPAPVIGNLLQDPGPRPWLTYHEWSKKYGSLMYLSILGQPIVVLSTIKATLDLLGKRGATYSDRPHMAMAGELATKNMHILIRPYDKSYTLHQRMAAPILVPKASAWYRVVQDMESRQMLADLLSTKSQPCNPHHDFERTTASNIYALTYGYRLKTPYEPELKHAHAVQAEFAIITKTGEYLVDTFPVLNRLPGFLAPWKKVAERHYEAQTELHHVNINRALNGPGWNFSKQLKNSPEAAAMSFNELAWDLGVLADAALDTTTMTMDWYIVAVLTQGHRFVAKAQQLLDEVVGRERLPTYADREKLPYLEAIVEELLRWRPIASGGFPHRNTEEDTYEGHTIPKGAIVIPNNWAIIHDESVFGQHPGDFIPERWLPADEAASANTSGGSGARRRKPELGAALKDLPTVGFGYGRRICVGRHIARNSLWIQIARLLWAYDVEPRGPVPSALGGAPPPYEAVFKPRGPEVVDIIARTCDTWQTDITEVLDGIGANFQSK